VENAREASKAGESSPPSAASEDAAKARFDTDLELEHVSVRYRGTPTPALADVSLRVRAGEVAALLGANGAGKSTILRVAAGVLSPDAGEARVGGRDVAKKGRQALAREIAFVPQTEAIAWGFRVRDVVAMGRAPHQGVWMVESADDRVAVEQAMERCDLRALADRTVDTLSGGEQRRVSIARALAQRPRVLLLDEPGAFLDMRHRLSFYGLLAEVAASDRIACLVAMHDLDAAARFASSAILMREGRIVASGAPGEVMTADRLEAALRTALAVGVDGPSGQRYFLPVKTR
jgi:iron complex transport system ATP-binding protein